MLSGADQLGSGKLHAQLENAKLEFGPATVNVPGGSADLKLSYEPTGNGCRGRARRSRWIASTTAFWRGASSPTPICRDCSASTSTIEGRAPTLDAVMAHANGRIDFAVWPKNMRSGIFDLWAVNLFVALVPAVDPAKESKVNCALGRFDLRDGKLTQDAILMDTSRMRVTGEGGADFGRESVSLRLAPKPKSPQFFSLATPVQVSGTLHRLQDRRCARRSGRDHRPAAVLAHPGADAEAHREGDPARRLGHLHQCPARGASSALVMRLSSFQTRLARCERSPPPH